MNYRNILFMISMLLLVIGIAMGTAILVGYQANDSSQILRGLTQSTLATLAVSLAGIIISASRDQKERHGSAMREGFIAVSLSWMAAIFF